MLAVEEVQIRCCSGLLLQLKKETSVALASFMGSFCLETMELYSLVTAASQIIYKCVQLHCVVNLSDYG